MTDDEHNEEPRMSPITRRIVNSSAAIALEEIDDITFQHTVLCQTSMPYQRTAARRLERRNGIVRLLMEAGEALDPVRGEFIATPLPYGPKARLILTHLNREAMRRQDPVVELEDSLTGYVRNLLDRSPNGREIAAFKNQMTQLSVSTIRLGVVKDRRAIQFNTQVVDALDLWAPSDPDQRVIWPSTVTLNTRYFESLMEHAVPLNERAVRALQHSAVGLDIYAWLAQRLHRIPAGHSQFVPWTGLHTQFGTGYKLIRQFRVFFLKQLRAVLTQYPNARVEVEGTNGMRLHRSPPPVRPKLISGPGGTINGTLGG
ncbi:MAG: replication protein RepA [Rhodococcus sp.]|nr:replication protein RepA [Rhodococcus sp. (in: high G+C Gram-positive bacteria)]